ncbi:fibronectin type III domain-containing protein [Anaeromyxobacter oryzae]|uniref:Fibronectin type-III domain-containing protein n=1 Tax=Anaeromyxobacter oryzae TaxID=2918170 RepID=A0ABM7WT98_9BACT|nr:fibronectin type III domain-containing protein [Anaeromyxobacter oryzae]BDG02714.1 hypothetical protein AMOR_17100 [Anaeromyxobacter oryzae]
MRARLVFVVIAVSLIAACGGGSSTGGGTAPAVPAAPTSVAAAPGDGKVTVSWTGSEGATSYDLYWSTSPGVSKASGAKVPGVLSGWAVTGLANGTAYYFVVTAVSAAGESVESAAATATPVPSVPAAPTGVTAVPGDGEVVLSWTGSSGATAYDVYWSTAPNVSRTSGTKVAGAVSGGPITGLSNGTPYWFVVTAVNAGGESAESSPAASATPLPPLPAPPTNVSAVAGDGQVTVSWTASTGATSYDLYWSTSPAVSKATGTKIAGAASGSAVTGLANGTPYYFVVTAVNLAGESAESSPAASATPLPPIPAPPASVTAVAGDGKVTVSWTASSGATSYDLYWSTSPAVSKATGTRVAGATSGSAVTGLANGTTYYFVITAVNLGGASAESSPAASATPVPPVPAPPANVSAVAGVGEAIVSWTASSGATSYDLYWSTSPAVSKATGTKITGAVSGDAVTGLAIGTTYYFVVTAVNLGGESAESSPAASATPVSAAPAAPTGVTAAAGIGKATVSWTASSGATSYNVYWSTSAAVSKTNGTKVAGATSGATIAGLTASTGYFFVVTAVNAGGESAESSAASVTALPAVLGSFAYSGAGGTDMAVDSAAKRVYVSGGIGQQGLIRIDASNPSSMSQTSLSYGGGIAVDTATGRYATTSGYSAGLYVFNADDSAYDSETISGCGGSLAADPTSPGRFFVSSQCNDHIAVYDAGAKSLVANVASNGVGSSAVFDPRTRSVFQNLTPNHAVGNVLAPLVVSSAYATSTPITGFVVAADPALGHLYVDTNGGSFVVLDSTNLAASPLHTFASTYFPHVAADTALGLFYATTGNAVVAVYDATSYDALTTLTLPASVDNVQMVPGDTRLYAIAGSRLYVIEVQ